MKRYFLNQADSANKFWDVEVDGSQLRVRYGKVGTTGQQQTKDFATPEAAQQELDKLVKEKTRKGYAERAATDAVPDKPAPAPPAPVAPRQPLQLLPDKVAGKAIRLTPEFKSYRLGSEAEVRQLLAAQGATVLPAGVASQPFDFYLGGTELQWGHPLERPVVFEEELCAPPDPAPLAMAWLRPRLYQMLRELLAHPNVSVTWFSMGNPVTEAELVEYEQRVRRPIPLYVKEFYRQVGELRLLWRYKLPPSTQQPEMPTRTAWVLDDNGAHEGVINIFPLHDVLFIDWFDEDMYYDLKRHQRVFDHYTQYHMMALDLGATADPLTHLGDDNGVDFQDTPQLRFSDYISLRLRTYGVHYPQRFFDRAVPGLPKPGKLSLRGLAELPDLNPFNVSLERYDRVETLEDLQHVLALYLLPRFYHLDHYFGQLAYALRHKGFSLAAFEQMLREDPHGGFYLAGLLALTDEPRMQALRAADHPDTTPGDVVAVARPDHYNHDDPALGMASTTCRVMVHLHNQAGPDNELLGFEARLIASVYQDGRQKKMTVQTYRSQEQAGRLRQLADGLVEYPGRNGPDQLPSQLSEFPLRLPGRRVTDLEFFFYDFDVYAITRAAGFRDEDMDGAAYRPDFMVVVDFELAQPNGKGRCYYELSPK